MFLVLITSQDNQWHDKRDVKHKPSDSIYLSYFTLEVDQIMVGYDVNYMQDKIILHDILIYF